MKSSSQLWIGVAAALALLGPAAAEQKLKVGLVAALDGPYASAGQDAVRGAELALKQKNGTAGGRRIEFVKASSDATPQSAVNATRKLVEQDKVPIVIGPLAADEGVAIRNYARSQPSVTFVNGSSAAQAATLSNPAPNFYRFNTESAQWMVGLGEHALAKGYKRMFLIAEDYGFPYSQAQGFMATYCARGGRVVDKAWLPVGTQDYGGVISKIPPDVDALLLLLSGSETMNFLDQYAEAGGTKPFVGGTVTIDQAVLAYKGRKRESLLGTPSAGPVADSLDSPEWKKFVADYKAAFKDALPRPSLFAYLYYVNTRAALDALDVAKGDLSGVQKAYRDALQATRFDGPAGPVAIDDNRNGVGTTYITEVAAATDGSYYRKVVGQARDVTQTLGLSKDEFQKLGLGPRDVPDCRN